MPNNTRDSEYQVKETIDIPQFLHDLPLEMEDKKKLLLSIATIISTVSEDTAKMTVAACMGLSTDDPKFNTFFNNDIRQVINLDIQSLYNSLAGSVFKDEEN